MVVKAQPWLRKRRHFVMSDESAKSEVVAQLVRQARKERLDYAAFVYVCQQARKKLGLRKPPREHKLPNCCPRPTCKSSSGASSTVATCNTRSC